MVKILLVEDNEMNRDMLTRRLQRKGYEVVIAVDGKEAVRIAQSKTADLILMDIRLPVMDGWEAIRRIKIMPETQSIFNLNWGTLNSTQKRITRTVFVYKPRKNKPSMKVKGETQMRTIKIYFLILSIALATAYFFQLPAAQADAPPFTYVANVAKDPIDIPPPIHRHRNKTVTVDLYTQEYIADIGAGADAWVWTFTDEPNKPGTIPGPMIRVMQGDTVVINLTNNMEGNIEPHNIDLHAAMGPGGGAAVTEIEPGETATLRFKALREGAYIYHCAAEGMAWEHVSYGMYGLIMVEPKGGLKRVDKEFYIGQSDWYHMPAGPGEEHGLPEDVLKVEDALAEEERPTMYSFNGHKAALTDPALFGETIRADQGDKVRVFMVTGGPNKGSNFHIIGTIWDKVYKGHHKDFVRNEETVYVSPGSAAVFELSTPVPGKYLIVDHALWRVPKGAGGFMWVDQTRAWPDHIFWPDPLTLP